MDNNYKFPVNQSGGGGSGTVTSVNVTTANGVSATGGPITTSGSFTFILGDITPSSIVASGTISGSNLSGTNTGDQTITLTSDVTGSGTGSFAVTIGANKVTYAKIQQSSTHTLIGNSTGGTANVQEITLGSGISFVGTTLVATGTGGTVTSVTSADNTTATVATTTTTPVITIVSAPKLQTARTINGTSFDGTASITVTAAAATLTGTTLNATVVTSSLTSVGTLVNLTVTNPIIGSITGNAATVTTNANLTGVITSVGNATSIASQTGTGTKLVVDNTPTLITPNIGAATGTSVVLTSTVTASNGTESTNILGVGRIDSRTTGFVFFSHTSQTGAGAYAVAQDSTGNSFVNAPTGKTIQLLINGSQIAVVNSTSIGLADGKNISVGTTTGTKIGTATTGKLGFWNATPVVQPSGANEAALTDSTTGTASFTLVDVGLAFSQANINNNFASVARLLNQLRSDLVTIGIIKGSA